MVEVKADAVLAAEADLTTGVEHLAAVVFHQVGAVLVEEDLAVSEAEDLVAEEAVEAGKSTLRLNSECPFLFCTILNT